MYTLKNVLVGMARNYRDDQDGAGSVFGIFAFAMLLIIGGLSLDGSNYWRHQQLMQQTADVAAHAGVVQIADSATTDDVKSAAADLVEKNMPAIGYGNLFEDQSNDIALGHYDEDTNTLSPDGQANAVSVVLHRDSHSGNPVDTLALRVSDLFFITEQTHLSEWNLHVRGVAVLARLAGCNSTDGIYADGELRLSSSNTIGARYCLHSQDEVWLPQQNTFETASAISMPDLTTCGSKCTDSANPGASAAAFERNLIMPDIAAHIDTVRRSFLGIGTDFSVKDEFFAEKIIEFDALSYLEDEGVNTSGLITGSVVTLDENSFEALPHVPEGLVYNVTCNANGNRPNTKVNFEQISSSEPSTSEIHNTVIVTNCGLDFGSGASVTSSVIISTRQSSFATVTASSGAMIGDPLENCSAAEKSMIMAMGKMQVPADFTGSNVSIIVDGDIHLSATSSSTSLAHTGLSMFSSGEINIAAGHTFDACALPPSGMIPELQVIRHVVPVLDGFTQ